MQLTKIVAASRRLPENYHNMPRRFVDRHNLFLSHRAPRLPQYTQKIFRYKKNAYYDRWRPWEENFYKLNQEGVSTQKIFVEPIRDFPMFRGDRVQVIKGPDLGKQGIVSYIVKERNWVFVQGLNLKREYKLRNDESSGVLICSEEPYLVNEEVQLVEPSDLMPTEFEWRYDEEGNRVRVSKRTERILPIPSAAFSTIDYVEREKYREQPKDTPADVVAEVTFEAVPKTFEMDLCERLGIKDERVPYPMYWY